MFYNPYESITDESLKWLKSNFHVHAGVCVEGRCGHLPMPEVLDVYVRAGYNVVAITNHDQYVPCTKKRDDISLIDGIEYSRNVAHMCLIGVNRFDDVEHQEAINLARQQGGFVILNHPNWGKEGPHWTLEQLETLEGYVGIEIFNAVIFTLSGWGLALDKWDHLLTLGKKVYGFGSDDFHRWYHLDRAYNMVCAKSGSFADIKEAVEAGRFYVSTGVWLERFSFEDGKITVKAKLPTHSYINTFEYRFVGTGGKLLYQTTGSCVDYVIDPSERYVRVEVTSESGAKMYLQPILNKETYFQPQTP